MRVALLNLGESPRIFYNRLNKAISVPVGKITIADLDGRVVQGLRHPSTPETILVGDESMTIPDEVKGIIDLLAVVEFESEQTLLRRFLQIAPPSNLGPDMRPSRQQIRQHLRTMIEDWVAAARQNGTTTHVIHENKDPEKLDRALREQEQRRQNPDSEHALEIERKRRLDGEATGVHHREAPPAPPARARPPVETAPAPAEQRVKAAKAAKRAKNKRRA